MKRRILAVLLAAATVLTSVPAYAAEPVEAMGENCVMQLEFEGNVADSIASERQTVVKKWSGNESINAQEGAPVEWRKLFKSWNGSRFKSVQPDFFLLD